MAEKPVHLGIPKLSFPGISASRRKQAIQTNSDGVMMLKSGDHAEAVAYFVRALQLDPGYVLARYNLACAYALSGDAKRAIAVLAQFRDCDREDCQRRLARARTDEDFRDCWSRPDFIKVTAPDDN